MNIRISAIAILFLFISFIAVSQASQRYNPYDSCMICFEPIFVNMPSSGEMEAPAEDFVRIFNENCGEEAEYRIFFSFMDSMDYPDQRKDWVMPTEMSSGDDVLNNLPSFALFYCDLFEDLPIILFNVKIYYITEHGDWGFCERVVELADNDHVCVPLPGVRIAGELKDCN